MNSDQIQLNDLFWTFQGEGRWTGRRALFVRLPFCNFDCPWCDTSYNSYTGWSVADFNAFATSEAARFAVITGGEPMAHKHLSIVISQLKKLGFYLACETNGSLPVPEAIDFVTISPKAYSKKLEPYFVDPINYLRCHEWKYVVDDSFDFSILNRHEIKEGIRYSLSPEFSHMKSNLEKIYKFIKENPSWVLSLQTHKWLEIP